MLELFRLRSTLDKGPLFGFPIRKRGRPRKNASKSRQLPTEFSV